MSQPLKKTPSPVTFPSKTRFLVVDDSQLMRKLVKQTLEKLGYSDVAESNDGQGALAALNEASFLEKPFDIVLADLWMIDMDGFNLLKACRSNPAFGDIHFFLVTAERDKKYISEALAQGVSGYIFKPLEIETLRTKLQDLYQEAHEDGTPAEIKNKKIKAKKRALDEEESQATAPLERDQLQAFINAVPGFVLQVSQSGAITEVNRYLEAKYNIGAKEIITPEVISTIFSSENSRTTLETQVNILNETHFFLLVAQRYSENTQALVVGLSLTGQKRAEEKLRGLVSQLGSLEEMACGIAHKLNIPLLVIYTRTSRLQKLAESKTIDPTLLLESVNKIETSVVQIKKIIKSLLTFTRDSDRDPTIEISVSGLIDEIIEFFRGRFTESGIALRRGEIPPDLTLECRESEILQVLLNLMNNAFDAVMEYQVKWVQIDVQSLDDKVEVVITDSGTGIPRGIREKIMWPFFTTKEAGKGTGLGLSICKSLVEGHGGTLTLDARAPNTRFVMLLPKHPLK